MNQMKTDKEESVSETKRKFRALLQTQLIELPLRYSLLQYLLRLQRHIHEEGSMFQWSSENEVSSELNNVLMTIPVLVNYFKTPFLLDIHACAYGLRVMLAKEQLSFPMRTSEECPKQNWSGKKTLGSTYLVVWVNIYRHWRIQLLLFIQDEQNKPLSTCSTPKTTCKAAWKLIS